MRQHREGTVSAFGFAGRAIFTLVRRS